MVAAFGGANRREMREIFALRVARSSCGAGLPDLAKIIPSIFKSIAER
jgi:hypothetical protein